MTHHTIRRLGPLACLTAIAIAIAGCTGLPPASLVASALPDGIPTPSQAAVVVGQGGGYDAGARLFAFSSNLAPADAIHSYETQLTAAGFEPAGSSGTWALYRNGATVLAVRAGASGPPTDLLVRVMAGPPASSGTPETAGGANGHGNAAAGGPNGAANKGGDSGAAGGNPAGNAGGNSGNAGGNAGASPNPNSNAGGNAGAKTPGTTPVPRPDPPNGKPSAPPGQVKATAPAAIRTAAP